MRRGLASSIPGGPCTSNAIPPALVQRVKWTHFDTGAEIFKIDDFYKACPFSSYGAGKTIPVTIRAARFSFEIASFCGALHPRAKWFLYRTTNIPYICSIVKRIVSWFYGKTLSVSLSQGETILPG